MSSFVPDRVTHPIKVLEYTSWILCIRSNKYMWDSCRTICVGECSHIWGISPFLYAAIPSLFWRTPQCWVRQITNIARNIDRKNPPCSYWDSGTVWRSRRMLSSNFMRQKDNHMFCVSLIQILCDAPPVVCCVCRYHKNGEKWCEARLKLAAWRTSIAYSVCRCALHNMVKYRHTFVAHGQTRPPDPIFYFTAIASRE